MKPTSAGDRRRFWMTLTGLLLLPLVALSVYYVVSLRSKAASCFTVDQVKNDARCLYIYKTSVYEKGTKAQPHQGTPCGTDVTSIIPDSHILDKVGHLDPNYQGDICTASEPIPTSTPAPTVTPVPTSTPAPTSTPVPTTAPSTSTTSPTTTTSSTSTTTSLPTATPTLAVVLAQTTPTITTAASSSAGVQTIPAAQKTPEVTALPIAGAETSPQFYMGSMLLLLVGAVGLLAL